MPSPPQRKTRIPTTSPNSNRGSFFVDSNASPAKRMRSPPAPGKLTQHSGKKTPNPRTSGSRNDSRHAPSYPSDSDATEDPGCVGASIDMIQKTMSSHTKDTYEYLFDGMDATRPTSTPKQGKTTPWMSMMTKMYEDHSAEKTKLRQDLKTAKQKSRQYKDELRDNLTERLKMLESKVLEQDGGLSQATSTESTATSWSDATVTNQTAGGETEAQVVHNAQPDESTQKKVQELEQRLQQANLAHTFEKEHWIATLNEAEKATKNGAALSKQVQGILEQVAGDWQRIHQEELEKAQHEKERLEKQLQEVERQKSQWQDECAKLKDNSRNLLSERNEYKSRLNQNKGELEKSRAILTELERKVDLCQRQTMLAQKKALQLEEEREAMSLGSSVHRDDALRQDPPSISGVESIPRELQRAMKERDLAIKEAEETFRMLEDYQKRLESDRQSYFKKLKHAEKKYEEELEARMEEFTNDFIDKFRNVPISQLPPAELERRYTESVEKRNELASRMRQLQDQFSNERGSWKLKLEAYHAENKKLEREKSSLAAENESQREQIKRMEEQMKGLVEEQKATRDNWEKRLEQASEEWVERLSEIQAEHQKEKEQLQQTMHNLRTYKENAETLATETCKQLDNLKEQHRRDILEWKEHEVKANHGETERLQNELVQLREAHQRRVLELQKSLQEETENVEQLKHHSDEVIAEWEQHALKIQEEKEALEEKLNTAVAKSEEQAMTISELAGHAKAMESKIESIEKVKTERVELENRHNAEISAWQKDYADLARKNKAVQDENAEWRQKVMKANVERDNALETAKMQVMSEQNEEILQLKNENEKLIQLSEGHGAEVEVWKGKAERLDAELHQATELAESLRSENQQLQTELLSSKTSDGLSWKEQYDDLSNEMKSLEKTSNEQKQQLQDWNAKVETLESSWMQRIEQLRTELKDAEQSKTHDREELQRIQSVLEKERGDRHREVEALQKEKDELSTAKKELVDKLTEMDHKMKNLEELHKTKLEKLNTAVAEKDEEISLMKTMLEELDDVLGLNGRGVAEMKEQQMAEKLEAAKRSWEETVRKERTEFEDQLASWKSKVESTREELQQKLEKAHLDHQVELKSLQEKLARAEEDVTNFSRQTNKLSSSLDQLQRSYDESKRHWQTESSRLRFNAERMENELKAHEERKDHNDIWKEQANRMQEHQDAISSLIEGVRGEFSSIKVFMQSSGGRSKSGETSVSMEARTYLEKIQSSLEGSLAKIAEETSVLLEHTDKLTILVDASAKSEEAQRRFGEQQERLVSEIQHLRDQVKQMGDEGGRVVLDKVRAELIEELHRKETELAQKCGDVNYLSHELAREKELRQKAEEEILALTDEREGLIRLQSISDALEQSMKVSSDGAGRPSMEEAEHDRKRGESPMSGSSNTSDSMIDEALALAQGLTDLVHGSGSDEQEKSVITMLENISDLMDQHDRGQNEKPRVQPSAVPTEVAIETPRVRPHRNANDRMATQGWTTPADDAPVPVTTPPNRAFFPEETTSRLHVVVNDLYARCHLLERERTQMMESTLELLQAARDASEAELQAALSTARRKSAEELLRVQEESQRGMWRMYHQLCSTCREDVAGLPLEANHQPADEHPQLP